VTIKIKITASLTNSSNLTAQFGLKWL